jgi:asparagine synthase (glutamine-hydrolysing)
VKLLYLCPIPDGIAFSNTLNALRLHPAVSAELDRSAIADFLLFGHNRDLETTTFRDIGRIPPGHVAVIDGRGKRVRRHWELPTPSILRYRRQDEYVDHFRQLLRQAVSDRLRTDRVGVLMSGGLDSPSLAATAKEILQETGGEFDLRAYTLVYRSLIDDREEYFSGLVGEHLGIPVRHFAADGYRLFQGFASPDLHQPEPYVHVDLAATLDLLHEIAAHSRVALNGEDVDALLMPATVREMLTAMSWWEVALDVASFWRRYRRPVFGFDVLRRIRGARARASWRPEFPAWINEDLQKDLDLKGRWEAAFAPSSALPRHPRRAVHELLSHPRWQQFLTSLDAGVTRVPLEIRLPYLDLRILEFCMAVPPLPWCEGKHLLRTAMRGRLPERVRVRRKTGLQGHPHHEKLAREESAWIDRWTPGPELGAFVDRDRIPRLGRYGRENGGGPEPAASWIHLRPWVLDTWLSQRGSLFHPDAKEAS